MTYNSLCNNLFASSDTSLMEDYKPCAFAFLLETGTNNRHDLKENKVLKLGRDPESDIVLEHPVVSFCHCLIWMVQFDESTIPVCYLKDVSLNGVFINGSLVGRNQIRILEDEDTIEIKYAITLSFVMVNKIGVTKLPLRLCNKSNWQITNKLIGYGTFGSVYIAKRKDMSTLFAVKIIKREAISCSKNQNVESLILQNISHPNIVSVYETVQSVSGPLLIFQDLICGGDLHSYLSSNGTFHAISETESKMIIFQVLSALLFLHENNIIHRDLKLDNILLETPEPYSKIFLSDFGTAKQLPISRTYTVIGTPEYSAPEVGLNTRWKSSQGYGKPCDIWSVGVVLYIMLSGYSPFIKVKSHDFQDFAINFDNQSVWGKVGKEAQSFLSQVLNINYYKRLTVSQCLDHSWIMKHKDMLEVSYQLILNRSNV